MLTLSKEEYELFCRAQVFAKYIRSASPHGEPNKAMMKALYTGVGKCGVTDSNRRHMLFSVITGIPVASAYDIPGGYVSALIDALRKDEYKDVVSFIGRFSFKTYEDAVQFFSEAVTVSEPVEVRPVESKVALQLKLAL